MKKKTIIERQNLAQWIKKKQSKFPTEKVLWHESKCFPEQSKFPTEKVLWHENKCFPELKVKNDLKTGARSNILLWKTVIVEGITWLSSTKKVLNGIII